MNNYLIGREEEKQLLRRYESSGKPEFIAIYGRRRVGKTFLVNETFKGELSFSMTGIMNGNIQAQLFSFVDAMDRYGYSVEKKPKTWYEAFQQLRRFLSGKINQAKRCIVFIDELPCFETPKSNFINALGYFWNSWASLQPNIMIIVCGSSTSWMMKNVVDNHGGLHDRITHEMHLKAFNLHDTEQYIKQNGFPWDRLMILQSYMVTGGVPYYLSLMEPTESLAQNIDRLYFGTDGEMRREFDRLYKTLFSNPEPYISIVETLFKKRHGLTREEIAKSLKIDANGNLTKMLRNLVDCDIIRFYRVKNKKIGTRNGIYQLMDFFTVFYLHFMKNATTNESYWSHNINTPEINSWMGLSFEHICLAHIEQIKQSLQIGGISTEYYSWRCTDEEKKNKAQIDLIIERADRMINLCEIKYSDNTYTINKDEFEKFQSRLALFKQSTSYNGGIIPTMVTTYGLQRNQYSNYFNSQLNMNCLFL